MLTNRVDQFLSRVGSSADGSKWIHIEDSFDRLTRNGFAPGTSFNVESRMGPGMILRASVLGENTVSKRKRAPVAYVKNRRVAAAFPVDEVRFRVSVGMIVAVPSVRAFSIHSIAAGEVWMMDDAGVTTPSGVFTFGAAPLRIAGRPEKLIVNLSAANIVPATETAAAVKPGAIELRGDEFCGRIAAQFFTAAGWQVSADGLLRR